MPRCASSDRHGQTSGRSSKTYLHACCRCCNQPERRGSEYVPLSRAQDGTIVTQFTMTTLEELGLLKMDFLGLRTLTVIQQRGKTCREKLRHITLIMQKIDYNDPESAGILLAPDVQTVCSSWRVAGMKSFMKELKPQSLEDVIAGISLYRPGPMDFIPQYIKGKNRPDIHHL